MKYKNRIDYKIEKNKYWDVMVEIFCFKDDIQDILKDIFKKWYDILNIQYLIIWPTYQETWIDFEYSCKFIKEIDWGDDTFRIKQILKNEHKQNR